jgi:hypothetical protein
VPRDRRPGTFLSVSIDRPDHGPAYRRRRWSVPFHHREGFLLQVDVGLARHVDGHPGDRPPPSRPMFSPSQPRSPRTSAIVAVSNGMCPFDPGKPVVASVQSGVESRTSR